jgi:hypothetical protein
MKQSTLVQGPPRGPRIFASWSESKKSTKLTKKLAVDTFRRRA